MESGDGMYCCRDAEIEAGCIFNMQEQVDGKERREDGLFGVGSDNHIDIFVVFSHEIFFAGIFFQLEGVVFQGIQSAFIIFDFSFVKMFLLFEAINFITQPHLLTKIITVEEHHPNNECQPGVEIAVINMF